MESVLKVIRIANGLQEIDIAKEFGTSKQNICELERSLKSYRKETLQRYSSLFNIEIKYLNKLISFAKNGYTFKELLLEYLEYTRKRQSNFSKQGNVFKVLRIYEEISTKELSGRIDKATQDIGILERNERNISISLIEKYAKAFGLKKVKLVYLIEQAQSGANTTDIMWLYSHIKENN